MRHDRRFRMVLRTQEEYLQKYKIFAAGIIAVLIIRWTYQAKQGRIEDHRLNSKLNHLNKADNEEDFTKAHEKWYFTLFDKRLWIFIKDLINFSKLDFSKSDFNQNEK